MFRSMIMGLSVMALGASSALAQATRDPVGESAYYVVDRASSRTSSLVLSGNLTATIAQYNPDAEPPTYDANIDYTLKLQFLGTRTGSIAMSVDEAYFSTDFLEKLRADGEFVGAKFKVRHLGYADARTKDGHTYPNCDKVLIYDIDTSSSGSAPFLGLATSLLARSGVAGEELEDLQITAHIAPDVPVLGAVKLDVAGKYQGTSVRAGADYQTP
jgi:hypothetical protein